MERASKRYRLGWLAAVVAISAACSSNNSSVTSVNPSVSTSAASDAGELQDRSTVSLIYEDSADVVSVGDAALILVLANLSTSTLGREDLIAAANRLMRVAPSSPANIRTVQTLPTVANADWAEPEERITLEDVAVVLSSQLRDAGDRGTTAVEAGAQRLMGNDSTVRLTGRSPGDVSSGGLARVVKNDGFDRSTVQTLQDQLDLDRLGRVARGGNVFLTPGLEFVLPASTSPERKVLRVASDPPITGTRNEPPTEFTARELGCAGTSCKIPDFRIDIPEDMEDIDDLNLSPALDIVDIIPLGFKAEEGEYTLTYEFSPDGFDSGNRRSLVFERTLTVTPPEELPFAENSETRAVLRREISKIANKLSLPIKPPGEGEPISSADVAWLPVLDLPNTKIAKLKGIKNLDLVQAIDVSDNEIQDLPEERDLKDLEFLKSLDISGNTIADSSLFDLTEIPNLEELKVRGNTVAKLVNLGEMPSLRRLTLSGNTVASVRFESSSLPALETLIVEENDVISINFANAPATLQSIVASGLNSTVTFRGLSDLSGLLSLTAKNNGTVTIGDMQNLNDLQKVDISNNTTLTLFNVGRSFPNIENLVFNNNAGFNFITDGGLTGQDLNVLSLSQFFAGMPNLQSALLRRTNFSNNNLDALQNLSNLSMLDLADNSSLVPEKGIEPLENNPGLAGGDVVILPATFNAQSPGVATLIGRGVDVRFEGEIPVDSIPNPTPAPTPEVTPTPIPTPPPTPTPSPGTVIVLDTPVAEQKAGNIQISVQIDFSVLGSNSDASSFSIPGIGGSPVTFNRAPFEIYRGFTSYSAQLGAAFLTVDELRSFTIDGVLGNTCAIVHLPATSPSTGALARSTGCLR